MSHAKTTSSVIVKQFKHFLPCCAAFVLGVILGVLAPKLCEPKLPCIEEQWGQTLMQRIERIEGKLNAIGY